MNKAKLLLLPVFALLIATGCSRKSLPFSNKKSSSEVNNVDFEYLSADSRISYQGDNNLSANADIRIKKDSLIWVSVSPGFGIEVARGLITTDSIYFMNRLKKEFKAYSFLELSKKYHFDLSFSILQAMLIGNMPQPSSNLDMTTDKNDHLLIEQQMGPVSVKNYINKKLMKIDKIAMNQVQNGSTSGNRRLNLKYGDFKKVSKQLFPYTSNIELIQGKNGNKEKTTIRIQYKNAHFSDDALSFPFNIPDKYDQQ